MKGESPGSNRLGPRYTHGSFLACFRCHQLWARQTYPHDSSLMLL